jgi:hypothetical protein
MKADMSMEQMAEKCRKAAERAKAIMAQCEKAGSDPTDALAKLMGFLASDAMLCGDFPGYDECRKSGDGNDQYDAPAFPAQDGEPEMDSIRFFRFYSKCRREAADRRRKFGHDLLMELSR